MPAAFDEFVKHQIGLQRLSQSTAEKTVAHLERAHVVITAQVSRELTRVNERGGALGTGTLERLKRLKQAVAEALREAHVALRAELAAELLAAAKYEADWLARFYNEGVGLHANLEGPSAASLRSVVTSRPFQGATLRDWTGQMEKDQLTRIDRQIRIGVTDGEGVDQIVRRLRGSSALAFRDGQFAKDRRGAEMLVRTAVTHVLTSTHEALVEPHKEDFPTYRWVAVLDSRTSEICWARDGEIYKTGEGPKPPAHPNCRSSLLYIARSGGKDFWDDSFWEAVPNYETWLKAQPVDVQNDVLGVKAGRLYRKGGLSVKNFVDRKGTALTLAQLQRKENAAWQAAFGPP